MGAISFINTRDAADARSGYDALCEEARFEYGNDYYNGTISTTDFRGVSGSTAPSSGNATKASLIKADTQAKEHLDRVHKGSCWAIDCGIVEYRIHTLRREPAGGAAPKYLTRYVLAEKHGGRDVSGKSFDNRTDAKAELFRMFEAGEVTCPVSIVKRPVLVGGSPEVVSYGVDVKVRKSRPKSVPAGARVEEVHRYVYYGIARC